MPCLVSSLLTMRISVNLISSTISPVEMVMFDTDVTLTEGRHVSGFTRAGQALTSSQQDLKTKSDTHSHAQ